jgi:hypothetical protein
MREGARKGDRLRKGRKWGSQELLGRHDARELTSTAGTNCSLRANGWANHRLRPRNVSRLSTMSRIVAVPLKEAHLLQGAPQ